MEKRRHVRKDVVYPAWIEGRLGRLVECTVANASSSGAQLTVGAEVELPRRFVLNLTQDGSLSRGCHVMWRKGTKVGIQYYALPKPTRIEVL